MAPPPQSLGDRLTFGIEVELLIRPKGTLLQTLEEGGWTEQRSFVIWNEWNEMWKRIATIKDGNAHAAAQQAPAYKAALDKVKDVRQKLYRGLRDILEGQQVSSGLSTANYERWAVMDEPSLDEIPRYWRVELISRRLFASERWQAELDKVFQILTDNCDIHLSTGCSMHVHVSPGPDEDDVYDLAQLKSILKATALFDKAITSVMPADRKENPYCQTNYAPRREQLHRSERDINESIRHAFAQVPSAGWRALFAQFDSLRSVQRKTIQGVFFGESRYLSWNFAHLASQCGTIEFRRPPGVRDAAAAKHWVAFTLGFLSGAMVTDFAAVGKQHAPVEALLATIRAGHLTLPRSCAGALNVALLRADHARPRQYSEAEMRSINRKKEAKKNKLSGFVEKLSSRPNSPARA